MKKNLQGLVFFLFSAASVFRKLLQFSGNRWRAAVFLCALLLVGRSVSAQSCFSNPPDNTGTTSFYTCTGGLSFSLSSNSNNDAPSGPDYGTCNTSGPRSRNAQWLIVKATDNGQIQLSTSLTTGSINIWVWGGFDTMPSDCTRLTNLSICGQYDHNDAITPFTVIKGKYYVILLAGMTGAGPSFTISGTGPANIPPPTVMSQSRCGSGPVTLTASGAQTGEKYNWYDSNGVLVQSGTNAQFTTTSLSTTAQYTVTISVTTNTGTSCESDPTAVTAAINNMPAITVQPAGFSLCQGSDFTLSVTAAGSTDLTYQWRKDGVGIPGSTSASYTITNAISTDAGSYDVIVSNSCGSITSDPAPVTVNPTPTVTVPANSIVCPGAAIPASGFTSSLSGVTYSWTNSNTAIGLSAASGVGNVPAFTATNSSASPISATITVTPALNGCAGNPVSYTINVKPQVLITVPADITVCSGATIPSSNFTSMPSGATYSWTNSNTATGLSDAGGIGNVHSFTATNTTSSPITSTITVIPTVNGCAGPPSAYTITVNPLPITSETSTDETVCGLRNGTITITATGSAPLEYSIDGGSTFLQNGGVFTGLAAGSYSVAVKNSSGCITAGRTLSIASPTPPPTPIVTPVNNSVCEGSDLTLTITNPEPGATYTWTGPMGYFYSGPETTRTITNISTSRAGEYGVTATVSSCVSEASMFDIFVNPLPVAIVPSSIVVCSGTAIAATSFTSTPDNANFTWSIDNSSIGLPSATGSGNVPPFTATNNTNSRISGIITVTPILNGCTGLSSTYTISVDPLPTATIAGDYTICYGGSANLSVALTGTAPWTITYTDGSASVTETGIMTSPHTIAVSPASSRTYTISSVSDATSCSNPGSGSATVTTPSAPLSATVSKTNVTCFGSSSGSISYIIGGGTAPYSMSYSHNSGAISRLFPVTANSGTITGLAAGSYEVTITDANNCTPIIKTVVITQPAAALAGTATSTNITCSGGHDGTIIISPSGGYGSYEYSINGGTTWQAVNTFTGLAPQTYHVKVRDAAQPACMVNINTALTITQPAAVTGTAIPTNVTCFGLANGTITIHASGGYGTYQYSIDGGTSWQPANSFTGLSPKTYNVQVRDAAAISCITVIDAFLTITQPTAAVTGTANSTNITCFGAANGTITISATGGYGAYEYSINNGTSWQAGNIFNGLEPDTYHVLVRDLSPAGCVASVNPALTIMQPVSAVTGTAASTDVTCYGMNNGTITVNAAGGSGIYEYTINGGASWQTGNLFSGLAPGNYNVQVRDAAQIACTAIVNLSLAIIQPAEALAGTAVSTNVTCKGAGNGTITIIASGGYGNYEYSINGGTSWQTANTFTALPPAAYNVQVRDAGQMTCTTVVNHSITIIEPAALTLDGSFTPIMCYGGSTNVTLIAGGGTGALEYDMGTGSFQSSNLFPGVTSGNYQFRVRDVNGCEQDYAVTIPEPDELRLTASTSLVQCDGTSLVILAAEGGTGNYQFKNGTGNYQASNTFHSGQGSYTFYVTDGACEKSVLVNIAGLSSLNLTGSFTPIACTGGNSTVTLVANGGNGNYTYKRDNGSWQSSAAFTVTSGDHVFAVRDAGGCQQFYQLNIPEPEKLNVALTKLKDASCFGTSTGSLDLKITGQKGTVSIVWFKNGLEISTPVNLNSLPAGKYSVQVTDACSSITSSEIIIEPSPLTVVLRKIKDADCTGTATGALELLISGGEGIATQVWTRNGITITTPSNLSALSAGTYQVTVHDDCNAVKSGTVIIDPATLQADFYKIIDVRCRGGSDGGVGLRVFNSTGATTVSWFKNDAAISTPADPRQLSAGTYYVQVTDLCSRIITEKITISEPEPLITTLTVKNTVCKTSNDGTITAVTTGGTQPYSYHWKSLSQATYTANNLPPGIYELLVTDANGCTFITSAEVIASTCAPVAADDRFTTDEEVAVSGSVAANDFDRQNENLTFTMTSEVKNGRIAFANDGTFSYTPNPGFWETETFSYRTCNTSGLCADATVTISVASYTIVSLTPTILNVKEGKKIAITAKLVRPFKDDVIITLSYTGSAGKDKDYVLLDQFQNIRIPKGQVSTTQKITIAALTDDLEEGDESIILQISATSDPFVRIGTGSVVIISDICTPDTLPGIPVSREIPTNPDITPDPLISPNGDGQGNEFFKIENIVSFPDNEVVIFNRWGNEVFRVKGYNESDRVFSGIANMGLVTNTNSPLPDGVYYYLITTKRTVSGQNIGALNKGYLILKR